MEAIKTRLSRKLFSAPAALGIGCLMALASPAGAATTTLLCPFEDASFAPGWTYTVDLDYAAGTIAIDLTERGTPRNHFGPGAAVITDRAIQFEMRDSASNAKGWPAGTWSHTIKGSIDRLAGTLAVTASSFYKDRPSPESSGFVQARCRAATQKF